MNQSTTKIIRRMSLAVILCLIVGGLLAFWHHQTLYPSTDDGVLHAHVVAIGPQVSGRIQQVAVHDMQTVRPGQILFTIDPQPFDIAIKQARAARDTIIQNVLAADMAVHHAESMVEQAHAQLVDTEKDSQRTLILVEQHTLALTDKDAAIKNLQVAKTNLQAAASTLAEAKAKRGLLGDENAQLREATAQLHQVELDKVHTHITAPTSGRITELSLRPGAPVNAYQTQCYIVDDHTWWVMAYFKETQIKRIHMGQSAQVTLDMYPKHVFHGHVTSISPNSGSSFSLLPAENPSGNWVKVTERFAVKVTITDPSPAYPLRYGSSATTTINTRSHT